MFAERFKRARKAAGLSMAALAERVDLTPPAISKYEHGTAMPSSGNLLKLAAALDPQELQLLKHEFGISMMAALYRAGQCGIISDSLRQRYFRHFSKLGWRTQEPGDPYPKEKTRLFDQLVYRALAEDFIGESKAAELMGQPLSRFHAARDVSGCNLHLVADLTLIFSKI